MNGRSAITLGDEAGSMDGQASAMQFGVRDR